MKAFPFFGFFLFNLALVTLSASGQEKGNHATFRGFGASLAAPNPTEKIYDYVLTVQGGNEKHSFRIVCDSTKIVDPQGQPVKDPSCGAVDQALNQSVEVIYEKGPAEPYRAVRVQCLEQ
jgi:hypothetical protein